MFVTGNLTRGREQLPVAALSGLYPGGKAPDNDLASQY